VEASPRPFVILSFWWESLYVMAAKREPPQQWQIVGEGMTAEERMRAALWLQERVELPPNGCFYRGREGLVSPYWRAYWEAEELRKAAEGGLTVLTDADVPDFLRLDL
jgi:hypothetical protein